MLNFIQKFLLNIQDSIILCGKKHKNSFANTTSKEFYSMGVRLSLTSKTEKAKVKIKTDITNILIKYKNNPDKLVAIIRKNGTPVYKIPYAKKILGLISYEQGLIPSINGFKALFLNLITSHKFNFETETMFIVESGNIEKLWMVQQFHKWYAMKLNLPGFDEKSQDVLNKYMTTKISKTEDLTIDEILGLKEAITRDVEAINFALELVRSTDSSKEALNKIKLGGANI